MRGLARTGALGRFAAGRETRSVEADAAGAVSSASGARVTASGWGWRHAGRRSHAVSELDLVIEPGERVLLLGPSGAGKSTLLAALAGVLGGDDEGEESGRLPIDGVRPARPTRAAPVSCCRIRTPNSSSPASATTWPSAARTSAYRARRSGGASARRSTAVGLDLPLDTPTSVLSGGQKQRLALAGVLAMRPGLVLLDEPTANLDPDGRASRCGMPSHRSRRAHGRDAHRRRAPGRRLAARRRPRDRARSRRRTAGRRQPRDRAHRARASGWPPPACGCPAGRPRRPARRRDAVAAASVLAVDDLAVGRTPFAARRPEVAASGIAFDVAAGRALALTGPNGAGKSTTALTIAGLLPPVGGAVHGVAAAGGGLDPSPHRWRSRELLPRIGTVFQDPEHQFLAPTVRTELLVGPRALRVDPAAASARADDLLERLRLSRLAEANPFTLSGGEKRRLSVATVLATAPGLLVLDEPTFGQDAITWAELLALLAELLDEGTAVVAVTHDRHVVEAIADTEYSFTSRSSAEVRAMSILTPTIRPSLVARINPVAKLGAALLISMTLLLSIDVVSAAVALALEAVLLGFAGLSARQFWLRTSPLWIAAPLAGLTTVLYGVDSGAVLWEWGFITVTEGSLGLGVAITLRVLAIGLPGIVLLATTDPTDLADGLAQVVRLPARFVLGALAGLRLVGLGIEDWRSLGLARRARGVADARGPVGAVRRFTGQAFALLVISVRRGSKLATAMEARGFGADDVPRSWARPSTFGAPEVALLAIGLAHLARGCRRRRLGGHLELRPCLSGALQPARVSRVLALAGGGRRRSPRPITILIDGPSGSGKSTFADRSRRRVAGCCRSDRGAPRQHLPGVVRAGRGIAGRRVEPARTARGRARRRLGGLGLGGSRPGGLAHRLGLGAAHRRGLRDPVQSGGTAGRGAGLDRGDGCRAQAPCPRSRCRRLRRPLGAVGRPVETLRGPRASVVACRRARARRLSRE